MDRKEFSEIFNKHLREKGMTLRQVAAKARVQYSCVHRWASPKGSARVHLFTVYRAAKALGVDRSAFFAEVSRG